MNGGDVIKERKRDEKEKIGIGNFRRIEKWEKKIGIGIKGRKELEKINGRLIRKERGRMKNERRGGNKGGESI